MSTTATSTAKKRKRKPPPPIQPEEISIPVSFPADIIPEILIKLPVKSLFRFKTVCKSWLRLISQPRFAKSQLENSNNHPNRVSLLAEVFNDQTFHSVDELEIPGHPVRRAFPSRKHNVPCPVNGMTYSVGSVNGLVCLHFSHVKLFAIWNPCFAKGYHFFPGYDGSFSSRSGFCYDSVTDDYKVVEVIETDGVTNVAVFSMRKNSWKFAGEYTERFHKPVRVNGVLHWLMFDKSALVVPGPPREYKILSFNSVDDTFSRKPARIPQLFQEVYFRSVELKGLFCLYNVFNQELKVWKMEGETWSPFFNLPTPYYEVEPLCFLNDNEILCVVTDYVEVVILNLNSTVKKNVFKPRKKRGDAISYVQSLIWPSPKEVAGDKMLQSLVSPTPEEPFGEEKLQVENGIPTS